MATASEDFRDFLRSAFYNTSELFGFETPLDVKAWQDRHPVANIASSFVGVPIPYLGGIQAIKAAPKLYQGIRAIGQGGTTIPGKLGRGAAEGVLYAAPTDAARLGVNALFGDRPADEQLASVALDVGLAGGIGVGAGIYRAFGRTTSTDRNIKRLLGGKTISSDLNKTYVQVSERLDELRAIPEINRTPDDIKNLEIGEELIQRLRVKKVTDTPERYFVGIATKDKSEQLIQKFLNPRKKSKKGAKGTQGLRKQNISVNEVIEAFAPRLKKIGRPNEDILKHIAHPIRVSYTLKKGHEQSGGLKAGQLLAESFPNLVKGTTADSGWMRATADGRGGFLVLEGLPSTQHKVGDNEIWRDHMLIYRTGNMKLVAGETAQLNEAFISWGKESDWTSPLTKEELARSSSVFLRTSMEAINNIRVFENRFQGKADKVATEISESQLVQTTGAISTKYIKPGPAKRGKTLIGDSLHGLREIERGKHALARAFVQGADDSVKVGDNLHKKLALGLTGVGGLKKKWDKMSADDVVLLKHIVDEGLIGDKLKDLNISPALDDVLLDLSITDNLISKYIREIQQTLGVGAARFRTGHYGIPRTWHDIKIFLVDENGTTRYLASGQTKEAAEEQADFAIESFAQKGISLQKESKLVHDFERISDFYYNVDEGIAKMAEDVQKEARRHFAHRHLDRTRLGIKGYTLRSLDRDELFHVVEKHLREKIDYMGNLSSIPLREKTMGLIKAFGNEGDLQLFKDITDRYLKRSSAFSQDLEKKAVEATNGVFGSNPLRRIVSAGNALQINWNIGMMDTGFTLMSALTFLQTSLPHLAFALRATPEHLSRYYSYVPLIDNRKGLVSGSMSYVQPFKILRESFRLIKSEDPEYIKALNSAIARGTIDPILGEAVFGSSTRELTKEAFQSVIKEKKVGQGLHLIRNMSEFGISSPERWSRMQAHATGYVLGRDFMGMAGEQLARFADEFTDATMYRYGEADKAGIFTGPIGGALGLFKNWQFHYIHQLANYLDEGFTRANFAPLLLASVGPAALGGAGITAWGGLTNALLDLFTDKSLMTLIYDTFNGEEGETLVSDAIYMGFPALFEEIGFGFTLGSRVAQPLANPARDVSQLFNFIYLGTASNMIDFGGELADAARGQEDASTVLNDRRVLHGLARAFAPKTFYKAFASFGAPEGTIASTKTGYASVDGLGWREKMLYTLGFTPTEVARQLMVHQEVWEDTQMRREMTSAYGKEWRDLEAAGDAAGLQELTNRALINGLDIDSVIRSAKRYQTLQEDTKLERVDQDILAKYQSALGK